MTPSGDVPITQADLLIKIGLLAVENDVLRARLAALEDAAAAAPPSQEQGDAIH